MLATQMKLGASFPVEESLKAKYFWFTRMVSWITSGGTSRKAGSNDPSSGTGHSVSPAFSARSPSSGTSSSRSEEHTSELQSLMRISYAVFCLKKKKETITHHITTLKSQQHTQHKTR